MQQFLPESFEIESDPNFILNKALDAPIPIIVGITTKILKILAPNLVHGHRFPTEFYCPLA